MPVESSPVFQSSQFQSVPDGDGEQRCTEHVPCVTCPTTCTLSCPLISGPSSLCTLARKMHTSHHAQNGSALNAPLCAVLLRSYNWHRDRCNEWWNAIWACEYAAGWPSARAHAAQPTQVPCRPHGLHPLYPTAHVTRACGAALWLAESGVSIQASNSVADKGNAI